MLRLKSNVKLTLRASRHINCIVSYSTPVLSISWLPLPSCPQSYPKSQPWSFLVFFGFEGRVEVEACSLELFFFKIFFLRNWRTWTRESVEFIKTVIYKKDLHGNVILPNYCAPHWRRITVRDPRGLESTFHNLLFNNRCSLLNRSDTQVRYRIPVFLALFKRFMNLND